MNTEYSKQIHFSRWNRISRPLTLAALILAALPLTLLSGCNRGGGAGGGRRESERGGGEKSGRSGRRHARENGNDYRYVRRHGFAGFA